MFELALEYHNSSLSTLNFVASAVSTHVIANILATGQLRKGPPNPNSICMMYALNQISKGPIHAKLELSYIHDLICV